MAIKPQHLSQLSGAGQRNVQFRFCLRYQRLYELLPSSRVWYELLNLVFFNNTNSYVKKAHMKSEVKMLLFCFLKSLLLTSQDDLCNFLFVI